METEKMVINLPAEAGEKPVLTILEGQAAQKLNEQAPLLYEIDGNIGAVSEFLDKRVETGQFKQQDCTILVNRGEMSICLKFNERDFYNKGKVSGSIHLDDGFNMLRINTFQPWTSTELAMALKMNRAFFKSKTECAELVSLFNNFSATVNQSIERSVKETGDKTDNFSQVVNSNLPQKFTLNLPIIKGDEPQPVEVETYAKVDGRTVTFILLSPGAKEVIDTIKNKKIDDEIGKIKDIAPKVAIIEI